MYILHSKSTVWIKKIVFVLFFFSLLITKVPYYFHCFRFSKVCIINSENNKRDKKIPIWKVGLVLNSIRLQRYHPRGKINPPKKTLPNDTTFQK